MVFGNVAWFIRTLTFKGLHNWPKEITGQPPRRRVGPKSFFTSARPQAAHHLTLDGKLLLRGFGKVNAKESINLPFSSWVFFTVGNVDRDIGRYSGRDSRSTVG